MTNARAAFLFQSVALTTGLYCLSLCFGMLP